MGRAAVRVPLPPDIPIVGGESGVAGLAGLMTAAGDASARSTLALQADSRVLVIGTEGDTDPEAYQRIVGRSALAVLSRRTA